MKEKNSKKVLRAVESIVRNEKVRNYDGWPPMCVGIFHQPKRPKKK